MHDYLVSITAYNLWATEKIMKVILDAGEEKSNRQQESSFRTIRHTLLHIFDAQEIWLDRIHGSSPVTGASNGFTGNLEKACRLVTGSCEKLQSYVSALDNKSVDSIIDYRNIKGQEFRNTVFEIVTHVVNHGTYHRGQLVTMLRATGSTELPATDLIAYYRETAS